VKTLFRNDWITFALGITLSLFGVISIISSEGGLESGLPMLARKQLLFLMVAIVLYVIFSFINYKHYAKLTLGIYGFAIIILAAVLITGAVRGGAERWILVGSYQIQPSEHAKLLMILVLARFFTRLKGHFNDISVFLLSCGALFPVLILIALEPDLGTAIIFMLIFLLMSFVSPISWKIPVTFVLMGILLVPAAFPLMKDYQKDRILSFINPSSDPLGKGYQSNQSKIAIGSGGFSGKGLFKGTQNKLDFIPSQSTDFIFSIVGEEGGFVLSSFVVLLYLFMFLHLGSIAARAPDPYGSMIIWGICAMIFMQAFVNIGMTIGIMPVTGIPLPFMSSGVNSLIVSFISLGVANSVYKYSDFPEEKKSEFVRLR
jgi:rod shape determining protein RodA